MSHKSFNGYLLTFMFLQTITGPALGFKETTVDKAIHQAPATMQLSNTPSETVVGRYTHLENECLVGKVKSVKSICESEDPHHDNIAVEGNGNWAILKEFDEYGNYSHIEILRGAVHPFRLPIPKCRIDGYVVNNWSDFDKRYWLHPSDLSYVPYFFGYIDIFDFKNLMFKYDGKRNLIEIGDPNFPRKKVSFRYDEKNKLKECFYYWPRYKCRWDGDDLSGYFVYRENGKEANNVCFVVKKTSSSTYQWTESTNPSELSDYYDIILNEDGRIIKSIFHEGMSSKPQYRHIYTNQYQYKNGRLSEAISYRDTQKNSIVQYDYDRLGNLTSMNYVNLLRNEKSGFKIVYQYDKYSNWIKKDVYRLRYGNIIVESPNCTVTREITYYN